MSVKEIYNAVLEFKLEGIKEAVKSKLDDGVDLSEVLNEGLIAAMDEVGMRFGEGKLFVPEMLQAALVMKEGLKVLEPLMLNGEIKSNGTVVIGTVKGDLHDIGKNLVAMMLEGGGFHVIDLGADVDTDHFITVAEKNNADIVALSALLTTTMPAMEATVKAIREKGLPCKTMIGGAPVTEKFQENIGAHAFAADAPGAVEAARELIGGNG